MNFKDARATLGKMAKGKYHSLKITIYPHGFVDHPPEYGVYIADYGLTAQGKSWQKAISKLQEKMVEK